MPSPFPGMDPYLEGYLWSDVHSSLACKIRQMIAPQIQPDYVARLEVSWIESETTKLVSIEIRDAAQNQLVTSIEIISPVNKREPHLRRYRQKRERIRQANVHLLEIDLLRRGNRVWEYSGIPDVPYVIVLNRAGANKVEVWPIALSDPLPILPAPLRPPDKDAVVDLSAALTAIYDEAFYHLSIEDITCFLAQLSCLGLVPSLRLNFSQ